MSQIIHVGLRNAPRVISRVGSMQNLDHVLQPTVGNYFRNAAQEVTVLEFLFARSARQKQVRVAQQNALSTAEAARGEGHALQFRGEGHAASVRLTGDAEAAAIRSGDGSSGLVNVMLGRILATTAPVGSELPKQS